MNSNVLQKVLEALSEQRARNEREEERRRREVVAVCPEIGKIMDRRRETVMRGVYSAFAAPSDPDLPRQVEKWNGEIRHLLVKNGFAENYLEPVFACAKCEDTGYTGSGKKTLCDCALAMYAALLGDDRGFEEEQTFASYDDSVFPDTPLPGTDVTQRQYTRMLCDKCRSFAEALPTPPQRTLLMFGGSGLGKTFLLRAIYAQAREMGVPALCITANQLIRTARQAIFGRAQEELDALYETQLLLIDDLGTEPLIENITVEQLFNLINERQSGRMCTVLSTNLTLNELKERYTERIFSRLYDQRNCLKLPFLGRDIRQLPRS